ncbi:MAG: hypothetical protein NVS9B15_15450 [Acidobacteriaceae bacterium]
MVAAFAALPDMFSVDPADPVLCYGVLRNFLCHAVFKVLLVSLWSLVRPLFLFMLSVNSVLRSWQGFRHCGNNTV